MTTRGERNNNPGNIDRNSTAWQGMADDQRADPRFIIFKTPQYGIRAICRLMLTYRADGCDTVRKIISRWAPPGENNTTAYIAVVAEGVGVGPDDVIDVDQAAIMQPLVKAIILHENGQDPYPDSVIVEAMHMAGISDAGPVPLGHQNTFVLHATGCAALVAGACSQAAFYAPTIKSAADQLGDFAGAPIIQHAVTVLMTVGGGLTLLGVVSAMLKQRAA